MKWLGHLLRLPKLTPARIALDEFAKPVKKPPGRPKTTWLDIVFSNIKEHMNIVLTDNIRDNLKTLETICEEAEFIGEGSYRKINSTPTTLLRL